MKAINTIVRNGLVLGLGLVVAAGCADNDKPKGTSMEIGGTGETFFQADHGNLRVPPIVNASINAGAKEDATIQAYHFDGTKLTSAGNEKLTRLVPDAGADATVYVNVPSDDLAAARRDAVSAFLGTCGVDAAHLKLVNGPNPNVSGLAAEGLLNLPKTDSGEAGAMTTGAAQATGSQTAAK